MEEKCQSLVRCVLWICGLCMILSSASSSAPSVTQCELLEHANITCYWTAVSLERVSYTLSVNMTRCPNNSNYKSMGSCRTAHTQCSVNIGSVSHCFCVDVLASSPSGISTSPRHCLIGSNEVKLYPPRITQLSTVSGEADCLQLEWTESVYVQTEQAHSVLEIQYSPLHQFQAQSRRVRTALHDRRMKLCGLHPGTKHYVRVRAQDSRAYKHWSSWSSVREATTAEAAPSAAPELWRHIQPVDSSGQRQVTLLWKPLQWPDSNGVILGYAVLCWSELNWSQVNCVQLEESSTCCVLSVSASQPLTCNLTTSNSAGASPAAHIHIPGDRETVPPPPSSITITSLDDFQLKVEWTVAVNQSDDEFVVEWFPIPDNTASGLYWNIVNGSTRRFIITDGVVPEVPYNVSVQVLYRRACGAVRSAIAFTRQGAPSTGPTLEVLQITSDSVTLKLEAVPVEKLHGFLQNYTVLYKINSKLKSQELGGDVEQFSLSGLSAGEYTICVIANTIAGGAAGPWVTVAVGNDYIQLMAILLCAVGTLLILIILLSQLERIQQCVCPVVPDPSKSSLSTWPSVSQSQNKLRVLDFKPPPSLVELIYVGRKTVHWDHHHHHQDNSQIWAFSYQSIPTRPVNLENNSQTIFHRPVLAQPDQQEAQRALRGLHFDAFMKDLTTSSNCKSKVLTKPQSDHQIQTSYPAVSESYLEVANTPSCRNCVSRLDSNNQVSSRGLSIFESSLGVDAMIPVDCVYKTNFKTRLDSCCFHSCFEMEAEESTNLIRKHNLMSDLESCCYTHVSTKYLILPEPSLTYDQCVMEKVDQTEHLQTLKTESLCYAQVLSDYLPVPVSHSDVGKEVVESASNQKAGQSSLPMCTDLKIEDTYRSLAPEECPSLLQFT